MLKLYLGKAHVICWIIIGSFVQAQGFSTTDVKEGEDAILGCGLQTTVEEGYLRWQAITNDIPEELAYDLRDGILRCDDRIINCTLHANGSIQLESVSKEDGARYYRCLRGDDNGFNYYSDHRLLVLSKESPSISQSPTSAIAFKASRKGIVHSYGEPVCEDDVDGNLPVVCSPPSGIMVDREYETIQCNCTDSDGLMDSVTFPVSRQMSSPPLIVTPHNESVSSYNMGKKGLLHGYNAPVCEDDVDGNLPVDCYPPSGIIVDRGYETIQCICTDSDGLMDSVIFPVSKKTSSPPSIETPHRESVSSYNMGEKGVLHGYDAPVCEDDADGILPVVCYPPSGIIVDREYETIQCNCTDSDGLMDSVTFPVTSVTHWVHPGWKKAFICLLVISIPIILVLICCYLYMELKKSKAYHPATDPEEMTPMQSSTKDQQISDLKDKIAALEAKLNNSNTELTERKEEQKEKQETEMKNKLEEQNEKISKIEKELAVKEADNNGLEKRLEDKQQQISSLEKILADDRAFLQQQQDTASKQDGKKYQEDENNSEFDKNSSPSEKGLTLMGYYNVPPQVNNIQTELTGREEEVSTLTDQLEQKKKQETEMKNKLEEQNEKNMKIPKEMTVKGWKQTTGEEQDQKILESSLL